MHYKTTGGFVEKIGTGFFDAKYLYSEGIRQNDKSSKSEVSQDRILKAIREAIHTSKREILHAANGQMSQKGNFQPKNEMFCL